MSPRLFYPLYLLAVAVVVGGLFEALLRAGAFPHLTPLPDERSILYRHDATLGWVPAPDLEGIYPGSQPIHVQHNALGLRGALPDDARPHRLLVLGDSYVWGFDVDVANRFTEHLGTARPDWDVVNAGVSGYGTDQALLLARRLLPSLQPDAVLLVYTPQNDHVDNATNSRYGYYKPYFVADEESGEIALHGVPVPVPARVRFDELPDLRLLRLVVDAGTRLLHRPLVNPDPSAALIRALRREVEASGGAFFVGLERADPPIADSLAAAGIPWVDLSTDERFVLYGKHWNEQGHRDVAQKVDSLLAAKLPGWAEDAPGTETPAGE